MFKFVRKIKRMKNTIKLVALFFLTAFVSNTYAQSTESNAEFKFEKETHDFGRIKEGPSVTVEFKFVNTGTEPLIIEKVTPACGCTTPEWPKYPIKPGETAVIKATYSSQGRPGVFVKTVTVVSNAKTPINVLTLKGEVIPAESGLPLKPETTSSPLKKE